MFTTNKRKCYGSEIQNCFPSKQGLGRGLLLVAAGVRTGTGPPTSPQLRMLLSVVSKKKTLWSCLVPKTIKNFQDSPSHRILRHMHETLNIEKNKTNYTVYL